MIWMYLVALVSFLAIDAVVLKFFMLPLFSRHIGEMLREQPSSVSPSASTRASWQDFSISLCFRRSRNRTSGGP